MPIQTVNLGEAYLLGAMLGRTTLEQLTLRLYVNDFTPIDASTAANFTQASGSGYAAAALTAGSWTVTAGNPATATYPQVTFTFTGALGNVYGYYVTKADGTVIFAERFTTAPFNIALNGDNIKITLNITLADLTD
jgi:hypothetical protein